MNHESFVCHPALPVASSLPFVLRLTLPALFLPSPRLVVVYREEPTRSQGSSAMALLAYVKSLFILQLLMGFVFVVSGLIINFIQLCTCIIWPFNKQLYRRINCRLSYSLWSRELTVHLHIKFYYSEI